MPRSPAVANMFYPGDKARLEREVRALLKPAKEPRSVRAVISPHAGYMYSGGVAGEVFGKIRVPDSVIILGPNHRGFGAGAALCARGAWDMPMGEVLVNEALAEAILGAAKPAAKLKDDPEAHAMEHSIEVQVPFLQMLRPEVTIVPITLSHLGLTACEAIAEALAQGIRQYGREVLLVASTDMTHYESQESASAKDRLAIERILDLDPAGLYEVVAKNNITMCGVIPTTTVLAACRLLGAVKAELVRYATSGEVTGDYGQVVGYAGFLID